MILDVNRSKLKRSTFLWGGLFLFFLLFSLAYFLLRADKQTEVVLFFPNYGTHHLTGESRAVPLHATLENNIVSLVNELILGPEELRHDRAVPRATTIRSLLLRNGVVYLDLSYEVLFPDPQTTLGFSETLNAIRKTITFNYPEVHKIVITVDGHEPKSEIPANYYGPSRR